MPKVSRIVTAVAVGGVDEGMIYLDEKKGWSKPFRNATDIYRLVATLGGYGMEMFMKRTGSWGDNIATPATALLTKSVIQAVRGMMATTSTSGKYHRRTADIGPGTEHPEFEGQRSY
jgi:hypothetical protein